MTHNADPLTGEYYPGNRTDRLHGIEQEIAALWRHIQQLEQQMSNSQQDVTTLNDELTQEGGAIDALTTTVNTFIAACEAMDQKPADLTAALATVKADLAKIGALQGSVTAATPAPIPTPPAPTPPVAAPAAPAAPVDAPVATPAPAPAPTPAT